MIKIFSERKINDRTIFINNQDNNNNNDYHYCYYY